MVSFIIAKVIDLTIGLRVPEEDELRGLDLTQHAETAYNFGDAGGSGRLGDTITREGVPV